MTYIPMAEYEDMLCRATVECRHDKDLNKIREQLDQDRGQLIRNVKDFVMVTKKVDAAIVKRRRELERHEQLMFLRLKELRAGRDPWFDEEPT